MALAIASDGFRMSSEMLNIHPFFKPAPQKAAIPSAPLQTPEDSSSQLSSHDEDNGHRQENMENGGEHSQIRLPALATKDANSPSIPPEMILTLSPPRPSLHGKLSNLQSTIAHTNNSEPQPKRRKVTLEPDILKNTDQHVATGRPVHTEISLEDGTIEKVAEDQKHLEFAKNSDLAIPAPQEMKVISEQPATQPQKLMKLRTDGRLFSPPKKAKPAEPAPRGRKPGRPKKQQLVVFKYGSDDVSKRTIGEKIGKILRGELRIKPLPVASQQKPAAQVQITPATPTKKPSHPFFLGKPKPNPEALRASSPSKAIAGTSRSSSPHRQSNSTSSKSATGIMFGASSAKIAYPPTAKEPLWPPVGLVHTRDTTLDLCTKIRPKHKAVSAVAKKSKEQEAFVKPLEDVLLDLKVLTNSHLLGDMARKDSWFPTPKRQILPKSDISTLVLRQLSQSQPKGDESLASNQNTDFAPGEFTSKAAELLFESLSMASSAFDKFGCENQQWIAKYSPKSTVELLQPQESILLLKQWLSGTAVHSTTNVNMISSKQKRKSVKKRKQVSEFDDFIVTSDDEGTDTTETRPSSQSTTDQYHFHKNVVRHEKYNPLRGFVSESLKHTKAVILSGPSGCGKTAMVHAIAHELGFEVFEINPGSRRSGKDILERVGDMTKNHLVSQGTIPSESDKGEEERQVDATVVREEIASGKQSTMQSFFKSKPTAKVKPSTVKSSKAKPAAPITEHEQKKSNRNQKQSLILLEEVDVLFEEDKQFWSTIITLIGMSKRPVIMTCNDETLLPAEELEECSVLYMNPPPENMAVDYMLLLAAHEGHLLERDAASKLYMQNKSDLRASIMQLNFWCQMAINDPTGGLNWMLFPQDYRDSKSQISELRVLSEGTFVPYMGTIGVNESMSSNPAALESNRWFDAAYEWKLDAEDILSTLAQSSYATTSTMMPSTDQLAFAELAYDTLSAWDVQDCSLSTSISGESRSSHTVTETRRANSFTTRPALLNIELDESFLPSSFDASVSLSYYALSMLEKYVENSYHTFDYIPLCGTIISRKASLSVHRRFIEESLNAALEHIIEPPYLSTVSTFLDLAPYIRSIISYDCRLKEERARLETLMSDGSRQGKRQRTTRASRAALEGGHKSNTRRERWFEADLDDELILETGGQNWQDVAYEGYEKAVRRWKWAQKTEAIESEDELCQ